MILIYKATQLTLIPLFRNLIFSASLNAIADVFKISVPYVSTIFKQETGENFTNYLLNLRMNLSKTLIEETDMSITDISAKVGYLNERSFYNAFKKNTNFSPIGAFVLTLSFELQ